MKKKLPIAEKEMASKNAPNFNCNDCGRCEYCQEILLNEEKDQAAWEDDRERELERKEDSKLI